MIKFDKDKPIIKVESLRKSFSDQVVLDNVNLDIFPGEIMVVMGGSGCGKSTLLRHIIGSLVPDGGRISLFGRDITEMSEHEINEIRLQFGILFQSGALINSLSVGDNVALPLREHTSLDEHTIEIMVKIKLELVSLRKHADKMPAQLSGGMKKRAALARAIVLDPQLLFYDEPSAGLDPVTSAQIDQLIIDLTRKLGVTSLVVTHEMDSAFSIADRMSMMDKGIILRTGTRADFLKLRDMDAADITTEQDRLIRQFLRGEAEGPLLQRQIASDYEEDLLMVSTREKTRQSLLSK